MTALAVEGLVGGYAAADEIVKGIALAVAPGEIVAVIGPNGAGKSTALKLIAGLLSRRDGRIALDGADLAGRSPQAIAAAGLVFVPQERNVFAAMTIQENLEMGALLKPDGAAERFERVFARFPILKERRRHLARTLSGGQRQMLAVAIALMGAPRLLLLDEPTAGLSPKAAAELFDAIRAIRDGGVPILMVEQNAIEALAVSDRGYILVDGRNSRDGRSADLVADPDVRRLFLGGRGAAPQPRH